VKPNVPERFSKHAEDMEKRLNFLYDHLNNDDLLSEEAISELKKVCSALEAKDYATATQLNVDFATNHSDKTGKWYPGLKRLISMAEATL
jgi:protein transport protein SEC31